MRTLNPYLDLAALILQGAIPLALIARVALARTGRWMDLGLRATLAAAYLLAIDLAGLWLALPQELMLLHSGLLMAAIAWSARRYQRRGEVETESRRGGRARTVMGRAPLAAGTAALLGVVGLALAGRRAPAGEALELRFPLRDGTYLVAAGGSAALVNPHVGTLEGDRFRPYRGQSYGVDLVEVGRWGSRDRWAPVPEAYAIYGDTILAPCDGAVVARSDGDPDLRPEGERPDRLEGNHVILACRGSWVVLAHMQEGSVAVTLGDSVRVGQPLGRVGNSGSSDEPHLHIHAQSPGTAEQPLSGDPIPMTFDGKYLARSDRVRGATLHQIAGAGSTASAGPANLTKESKER